MAQRASIQSKAPSPRIASAPTRATLAPGLTPDQQALLTAQRLVGNRAVASVGPTAAIAIQRWPFGKKNPPPPPPKTHEKASAKEMTSQEGADELKRVKDEIERCLYWRNRLIGRGVAPDVAARQVFSEAPEDIKRYLPLHSEFDVVKREVDKARNQEGDSKQGRVAFELEKRSKELGYAPGTGDPAEVKVKDVEGDLEKDEAFRRQMERRAERRLLGEKEAAIAELEAAQKAGDGAAVATAQKRISRLSHPEAYKSELVKIALSMKAEIEDRLRDTIEEQKAELGVDHLDDAEVWRLREQVKHSVRKEMEGGIDKNLALTGKIVGVVSGIGSKVVKGAKGPVTKLTSSAAGLLKGLFKAVSAGLKSVGGLFSQAVKLVGQVADRDADKLDKDAKVEIAQTSLNLVRQAAAGARGGMMAAKSIDTALASNHALMAAIPGVSIASSFVGFLGNVAGVVPPTERLASTVVGSAQAAKAKTKALEGALDRTVTENALQITTEVVGATANGIRIGASIAEIATAGGMGVPAAVKAASYGLEGANKLAGFFVLEKLRGRTQDARERGALQVEGSGQKLITTDVTYAVDTIILAAKKAIERQNKGVRLTAEEQSVLGVAESYGIGRGELARLSLGEIHTRMMDKLGQDDEQRTIKMKLEEGLESVKETLKDLTGDKEEDYVDLDTVVRQDREAAEAKANMTTGDKVKGTLGTVGKYAKKAVTAPLKVKKVAEVISEKDEKLRRLRDMKNALNYKGRSDRGALYISNNRGVDISDSVAKFRRWIVATQPPEAVPDYLRELNTISQQGKIEKKSREQGEAAARAEDKPGDRVITPALFDAGPSMSQADVRAALQAPNLGKADRQYLEYLLNKAG